MKFMKNIWIASALSICITCPAGIAMAQPVIDSLSTSTLDRSGRLRIFGSNLGAEQGNGYVEIDGIEAFVTQWDDAEIVTYIPEQSSLGSVDVRVYTDDGASDPAQLEVTTRQSQGVMNWRFAVDGDYMVHRPGIGADGTVYVSGLDGHVYAVCADGGLKWVVDGLRGQLGHGSEGPVQVGNDGTVYVGLNPLGPTVELVALGSDGSTKWVYTIDNAETWLAGPNLGPDGNIYGVMNVGGDYGIFSVAPDGHERWHGQGDPVIYEEGPIGAEVVFGPSTPNGKVDQFIVVADRNGPAHLWSFDMTDGSQNFAFYVGEKNAYFQQYQMQPATNEKSGDIYYTEWGIGSGAWALQAFAPDGSREWVYDPYIASEPSAPDVGPDGTIYFSWDLSRLGAVTPDGQKRWTVTDTTVVMGDGPIASPTNNQVAIGGMLGFGKPGWFRGYATANGAELWRIELPEENGGNIVPSGRAKYNADGSTMYFLADVLGGDPNNLYCYLYSIDTGEGSTSLTLDQTELRRGQIAQFTVSGAEAGERVYYFYSLKGTGNGPCPKQLGGLCLDLLAPITKLGSANADGSGIAVLSQLIPANAPLIEVHTQAVIRRGSGGDESVKSNAQSRMIQR